MKHVLKKMLTLIITLLIVSFITFLIFEIIPGDPAVSILGTDATKETVSALNKELGLDKPFFIRYVNWLTGFVSGDLGISYTYKMSVAKLVGQRIPITLALTVMSVFIILFVGIPLGVISGRKEGSIIDFSTNFISQLLMSVPPFFMGIILTIIFGVTLNWFNPGGYVGYKDNFSGFLKFMIFPALAVAIPKIAMVIKFLRGSTIIEFKSDYVVTARGKGIGELRVMFVHVLKNALIPVITFMGVVVADIVAGSIVVEQVFAIPGMGRLLISSIGNRDYPVISVIIVYIAAIVVITNFLVDELYYIIDPRLKKNS